MASIRLGSTVPHGHTRSLLLNCVFNVRPKALTQYISTWTSMPRYNERVSIRSLRQAEGSAFQNWKHKAVTALRATRTVAKIDVNRLQKTVSMLNFPTLPYRQCSSVMAIALNARPETLTPQTLQTYRRSQSVDGQHSKALPQALCPLQPVSQYC